MKQHDEKKEIYEKLENQLKICKWESINNDEYFQIELPVVLYFNYQRLLLNIYPTDDGYCISDNGDTFIEYKLEPKYYYDLYIEKDKNYHYDIKFENNYIYKTYQSDYSLLNAIDEFIRFFIYLDDFLISNDIRIYN